MSEKDFYHISLKLIIKNNLGEVLILKDRDDGSFSGFYDLPGGRINKDEFSSDYIEIVKRELYEETGLKDVLIDRAPVGIGRAKIKSLDQDGNKIRVFYVFFEAKYLNGNVIISREHSGFKWVNLKNIKLEDYFTASVLEGLKQYLGN